MQAQLQIHVFILSLVLLGGISVVALMRESWTSKSSKCKSDPTTTKERIHDVMDDQADDVGSANPKLGRRSIFFSPANGKLSNASTYPAPGDACGHDECTCARNLNGTYKTLLHCNNVRTM